MRKQWQQIALVQIVKVLYLMITRCQKANIFSCCVLLCPLAVFFEAKLDVCYIFMFHIYCTYSDDQNLLKFLVLKGALFGIMHLLCKLPKQCFIIDALFGTFIFFKSTNRVTCILAIAILELMIAIPYHYKEGIILKALHFLEPHFSHIIYLNKSVIIFKAVKKDLASEIYSLSDDKLNLNNSNQCNRSEFRILNIFTLKILSQKNITNCLEAFIYNISFSFISTKGIIILANVNSIKCDALTSELEKDEQLFSSSAHEIRNPLNSVSTLLELAEGSLTDTMGIDRARHYISTAKFSTEHALSIARNLLDLASLKKCELRLNITKVDFKSLITNIFNTFKEQLNAKNIFFLLECKGNIPQQIFTDQMRITQVIYNLISNSSKFTKDGGNINFKVETIDYSIIKITIQDFGVGISEQDSKRLGNAFYTVKQDGLNPYGIGLGLMISKQIASKLGSGLEFSSTQNEGTSFWFTVNTGLTKEDNDFFIKESQNNDKSKIKCNSAKFVAHKTPTRKNSIKNSKFNPQPYDGLFSSSLISNEVCNCKDAIVLDDNHLNRLVLKRMLESLAMTAEECSSGIEAMEFFHRCIECKVCQGQALRIIFTDVNMPLMSGYEFAYEIRKIECDCKSKQRMPIYAVTGDGNDPNARCADCFTSILIKPIDKSTVKKILIDNLLIKWETEDETACKKEFY